MEDFLNHMIAEVSKQQQALQKECGLLKDLLKPWPRKKAVLDESEIQERITIAAEVQKTAEQKTHEDFSHDEKLALSQVDKLLQKAEKTRHLKSKMDIRPDILTTAMLTQMIKRDIDQGTVLDIHNTKTMNVKNYYKSESSDSALPNSSPQNIALDIKKNNHKSTTPCVPSSKQNSETHQSQIYGHGKERKQIYLNKNSCSATIETDKDSKQKSCRPPSSHKPSSSRVRHIPAHMLAPFKTSDSSRFPKWKKSNVLGNTCSTGTARRTAVSMGVKTYKTLPKIASVERSGQMADTCTNSTDCTDDAKSDNTKEIVPVSDFSSIDINFTEGEEFTDHLPQQISSSDSNLNCSSTSNMKTSVDCSQYSVNCTQDVERDQPSQTLCEAHFNVQDSELQQFTLQKKGSSLKLPSKLVKLVNTNRSLQDRLSSVRPVKDVPPADPAQIFVERLCTQEEITEELRIRVSALTCLRCHQMLLDTLQNLHLDQLSDSTSVQVFFRTKRILEFVLKTFAELEEEADYYSKVKYRHISPIFGLNRTQEDKHKTLWLDTGQQKVFQDDVWEYLQTCKRWTHLHFTEKYLQLHVFLVQAAQAEWLKTLTSMGSDSTVFQGVYGLLTTHGQFLPAIVENPDTK